MSIDTPLFGGSLVRLSPIDHERDPEVVSKWTHDSRFMRMMYIKPMKPLSAWQAKKKQEELEKKIEESHTHYHFRIRSLADDRLLGFAEITWISWSNACGSIRLGIGSPADWRKGYGSDAMRMLLRYAFMELNLYRLTAVIPEYNLPALAFFRNFGFVEEVRQRKALDRDAASWDLLNFGLIAHEWKEAAL